MEPRPRCVLRTGLDRNQASFKAEGGDFNPNTRENDKPTTINNKLGKLFRNGMHSKYGEYLNYSHKYSK